MILGHGIDVVDLVRVGKLLAFAREDFLLGTFTVTERELWYPQGGEVAHFGGRLAAKEAVAKALGTGFSGDISWQQVEVDRDEFGRPSLRLYGAARQLSCDLRILNWSVSISHSARSAIASAIAEGQCGQGREIGNELLV